MLEPYYIYFRITGYITTIVMHTTNIIYITSKLQSKESLDLLKDPEIRFFTENQPKYFTCWTFFFQILYAIVALYTDWLTLNNRSKDFQLPKRLRKARDTFFAAIVWPASLLTSSMFWSLFTIDRKLVFPEIFDNILTRESNHIIHTLIIPVVLWEMLFRPRVEPRTHWVNVAHTSCMYVVYFAIFFYSYYESGRYIYPVFGTLAGTIYFYLYMCLIYFSLIFYYFMQWPLRKLIHGGKLQLKSHRD